MLGIGFFFVGLGFCLSSVNVVIDDVAVDHVSELPRDGHESGLGLVGEVEWRGVAERVVWDCSSLFVGLVVAGWDATACHSGLALVDGLEVQGLVEWAVSSASGYAGRFF